MSIKIESGRKAKKEGHDFEDVISKMLTEQFETEFLVEGSSKTKVDVRDVLSNARFSVKNPSGKNTQIGLYTQHSFIEALDIKDSDIINFIGKFFGGDTYSNYPRHRMTRSKIDSNLNDKFTQFLNDNIAKILDLLATHGYNQDSDVNYMIWAKKKNDPNSIILIDLNKFKEDLMKGKWTQNETTFEFRVNDAKLFHLQMKGSGPKYTSGYHSLMFHVHSNFDNKYVKDLDIIKDIL
jgi:hypothetical protein